MRPTHGKHRFFAAALAVFLFSVSIGQDHPEVLRVGYGSAVLMLLVLLLGLRRRRFPLPPEAVLLGVFVIWAITSGLAVAISPALLIASTERLLQVYALVVLVSSVAATYRSPMHGFFAVWFVGWLLGLIGLLTGEFASTMSEGEVIARRASSLVHNPNTLGVGAVFAIVAVFYFAPKLERKSVKILLGLSVPVFLASVIASGSRKALVLPIVFFGFWLWYCYRREVLSSARRGAIVFAVIVGLWFGFPWVLQNTFGGARLRQAVDVSSRDDSTKQRLENYERGWELFVERIVSGVGLGQWSMYASHGGYAHSEYVEVFATTGGVGGCVYFGALALSMGRFYRLRKRVKDPEVQRSFGLFLAYFVTVFITGFGQVLLTDFGHWALMGSVWGYGWSEERAYTARGRRTAALDEAKTR